MLLQGHRVKRNKREGKERRDAERWSEARDRLAEELLGTLPGGGEDILGTWLPRLSVFYIVCFSQFPLLFRKLDYVTTCTHMNRHLDKIIHLFTEALFVKATIWSM